uniref:WLM domain-containing protein n=1 Tax=viral metagenome TaxID=1070528 RepID=A0A6C0K3Q9_9ZZZZ
MTNSLWKSDFFTYIIIGFIVVICIKIYTESELFSLKCVISTIDGNKYCVRDRQNIKKAANLLATVTNKCKELVKYVGDKYPNDPDVERLVKNFNPQKISETLPNSELTAYSENKGEKIAFCLSKTKESTTLVDVNTLTFVAIHELSHVMTKSVGHKQEFWQNFKFLLENAKAANIYVPVDYKKKPQNYCGMTITDSPYYDL